MSPWAFGVPLVLVSALGLLLNAYVLLVVLGLGKQTQQQQTANTLLLIHLGAVEFAVCLVLLIFTTGPWTVAGTWCYVHGFLLTLLHPIALWTITGLNCDRYYAIAAPLHYTAVVSPRRVIFGLIGSWTGSLLLCLPPLSGLVPPYKYSPDLGCCIPDFGNNTWGIVGILYASIYVLFGLVLPAALVTICNLRVLGIARYHRHRIASAIYEVTLSAQVTITHQRNPFFVPNVTAPTSNGPPKFHSAASTVMQLVGSVYLLYFPYCGLILWEACNAISHNRLNAHPPLASLASLLLASSPPINGLLYGLKSRTLRRSVQNYWRKKITKSELQQEIQARTPSVAGSRRPSGSGPVSLFPFPPLQRRLSEALLNLGTNARGGCSGFESGNIGAFNRGRLQPAASCNTLRVPTNESGESTIKLVRTSASTSSLMNYRNEYSNTTTESINNLDGGNLNHLNCKRSPRILITRTYSVENPDGNSPILKKSCNISGNSSSKTSDKKRWRHISTGSDSSTGSSDASVWTTGIIPKVAKSGFKNSMDNWPAGKRFTRVRTLEEGALMFTGLRRSNNSESSDTTDTTVTTTTTSTLPVKMISMAEEFRKNSAEKPREKSIKNDDEHSESEPSWSSIDEENEEKLMSNDHAIEGERSNSATDNEIVCEIESPGLTKKYCKKRKEKSRAVNLKIIRDGNNVTNQHEGGTQLRPLLTPSS